MNLLFRITEAEKDGGRILIDGIDTVEIGTSILRTKLSIIPQDPVMFSNTVRYNLDPFGDKSDVELWEVLKKVQLDDIIAALPLGLEDQVAEGGENYSQGQRQLLCIARSLLRNPKILVMDEATASIDNKTDADIQRMIRENFADATVLTIAHRLGTIMDMDLGPRPAQRDVCGPGNGVLIQRQRQFTQIQGRIGEGRLGCHAQFVTPQALRQVWRNLTYGGHQTT